jgi:hypothetical protein
MAQAVSRSPLTAEAGFAPGSFHVKFVMNNVTLGQASSESPCQCAYVTGG